jgi:hypothetical protein
MFKDENSVASFSRIADDHSLGEEVEMKLRVIEGGRGAMQQVAGPDIYFPSARDVRLEAERRLRLLGYDRLRNTERATGSAMPRAVHYLALQITFVADKLTALPSIPDDFRSDRYWPT